METFQQEIDDGLGELLIPAKASFAFDARIESSADESILDKLIKSKATASIGDDELYPIKTILVSTGWNENDDVFLPDETYLARATPEDKPINYEHNEIEIIGHMTANHCVDNEGNALANDLTLEAVPETFHIVTDGVLYLHWQNDEKKKLLASIIKNIQEKKGRVSMECFFAGFDYAVIKNDKQYVLARNQSTAFLTKFLKAYGGNGVYDGCRVGRAFRNISFSGKGIVSNPANPKSVIFTDSLPFKGTASVVDEVLGTSTQENTVMSKEIELQAQVDELKRTIASLTEKNEGLVKTVAEADTKVLKSDVDAAKASVAVKDEEIKTLKAAATASEGLVSEMKTKLDAAEASVKELNDKIAKAAAEQVKATRLAALKGAGLDDAAAAAKLEKFGALDDNLFAEVVALVKPVQAAASTPAAKPEEVNAGEVVDGADKGKQAALASTTEQSEKTKSEKVQTDLAGFAQARLNKNKTSKKV